MHGIVTQFYAGMRPDNRGRMLADIWSWDHHLLEDVHDYIQWLFPLRTGSSFNAFAPLVTDGDVAEFKRSPVLLGNLLISYRKLLDFYGFEYKDESKKFVVLRTAHFKERTKVWLTKHNHNYLRITRILSCLRLFGLQDHATAFFAALAAVYHDNRGTVGKETLEYWRSAV